MHFFFLKKYLTSKYRELAWNSTKNFRKQKHHQNRKKFTNEIARIPQ